MEGYLRNSSESTREMKQMIPTYAAALEARTLTISKEYIEILWHKKREKQREKRRKEESDLLLLFSDWLAQGILAGADQQYKLKDENSALKAVQDSRNEYKRQNLPVAQSYIDYLEYDDVLLYLRFFTTNTIEASISYGVTLARRYIKKPGARMDGKPIPSYFPVVKVKRMLKPKVTPIRDGEYKGEKRPEGEKGENNPN